MFPQMNQYGPGPNNFGGPRGPPPMCPPPGMGGSPRDHPDFRGPPQQRFPFNDGPFSDGPRGPPPPKIEWSNGMDMDMGPCGPNDNDRPPFHDQGGRFGNRNMNNRKYILFHVCMHTLSRLVS